jgi:acetyl esterase/lipase
VDLASRLDAQHMSVYRAMPDDLLAGLAIDIPAARARSAALAAAVERPPWPERVSVEDRWAPNGDGPDVLVRLYRPAHAASPAPALYWVHGGGLVMGSVAMDEDSCAAVADDLGIVVASVEYRLAPEHPYPAPLEDCYAGLRWLAAEADDLGLDRGRLAIGGASAGGGLAAGLALVARDRGEVGVCFQLLVYPMLDDRNVTPSSHAVVDPKVWNRDANTVGWNAYLAGGAGADDVAPYAAPARATDLAGLPPAYVNVGDLDLFVDEDIAYAQALMRAGVPVELHVYPGAFHGSNGFVSRSALSRRWTADERGALARALGVTRSRGSDR